MLHFDSKYYPAYHAQIGLHISEWVQAFDFSENNIDFSHRIIASAVFSSNIEGNSIDLNSYLNWKSIGKTKPSKEIMEINDLIGAYEFAREHPLNEINFLRSHKLLSQQLLIKSKQGKYRQEKVGVFGESGLIYLAIEPEFVKDTMRTFFIQLTELLNADLSLDAVFFYAAFIHLRFAHIHPFADGNGRAARLIEKWFLAEKLGVDYWKLPSEKYYKEHLKEYYTNIHLGVNYYELNYDACLPFLAMLPHAVLTK